MKRCVMCARDMQITIKNSVHGVIVGLCSISMLCVLQAHDAMRQESMALDVFVNEVAQDDAKNIALTHDSRNTNMQDVAFKNDANAQDSSLSSSFIPSSHTAASFSVIGAKDFIRSFFALPSPLNINISAPFPSASMSPLTSFMPNALPNVSLDALVLAPSAAIELNTSLVAWEGVAMRALTLAKAVLFRAMLKQRSEASLYLALASLEYRLFSYYHLRELLAYLRAYKQEGGTRALVPHALLPIFDAIDSARDSIDINNATSTQEYISHDKRALLLLAILQHIKLDDLPLHFFIPQAQSTQQKDASYMDSYALNSFFRVFWRDGPCLGVMLAESTHKIYANKLAHNSSSTSLKPTHAMQHSSQESLYDLHYGLQTCIVGESKLALLPFDEELYVISGDKIYRYEGASSKLDYHNAIMSKGVLSSSLYGASLLPSYVIPLYARLSYSEQSRPNLCRYDAMLVDRQRRGHLRHDLARAGYGGDMAISSWIEDITGGEEDMDIEYVGYLDIFNDGKAEPIIRTRVPLQARIEAAPSSTASSVPFSMANINDMSHIAHHFMPQFLLPYFIFNPLAQSSIVHHKDASHYLTPLMPLVPNAYPLTLSQHRPSVFTDMIYDDDGFTEAFSLTPSTMQIATALSAPNMFLQGRIPILLFIRVGEEVLGCVRDANHTEEKLFSFHRESPPELIAHHRLHRTLASLTPLLPTRNKPHACRMNDDIFISDMVHNPRYALLMLGEQIIMDLNACNKELERTLSTCQISAPHKQDTSIDSAKERELECRLEGIERAISVL